MEDCYLIGVRTGDKDAKEVIAHETAHALYSLYPTYKKSCDLLFKKVGKRKKYKEKIKRAKAALIKMGYCEEVLMDEIQAYWSTGDRHESLEAESLFTENLKNFLQNQS